MTLNLGGSAVPAFARPITVIVTVRDHRRAPTSARARGACALLASAGRAGAQAFVHPQQIRGVISFSNVQPEIRAEIDRASARGEFAWVVYATSTTLLTEIESETTAVTPSRTGFAYEMTVESSADGIGYRVHPEVYDGWDHSPWGLMPTTHPTTTVFSEPAPDAELDVVECASLLRLSWVDAAGATYPVTGGEVRVYRQPGPLAATAAIADGSTSVQLLAPGDGASYFIGVTATSGTDVTTDLVRVEHRITVPLACDQVFTHVFGAVPDFQLGRAIGRFDVLGVEEVATPGGLHDATTRIDLNNGPWLNQRVQVLEGTPASGDFALENLVPSAGPGWSRAYQLEISSVLRHAGRLQELDTRRLGIRVPDGGTLDLGDSHVIDPGYITGEEILVGPPSAASPGGPVLADATAGDDWLGFTQLTATGAQAALEATLDARLMLGGGFDAATGILRNGFELVAGGLDGLASQWTATGLRARFADRADPSRPETYRDSIVTVTPAVSGAFALAPAQVVEAPLHLCFGQLDLQFVDLGGTFTHPALGWFSAGELNGLDFEENERDYDVQLVAQGTPLSVPSDEGLVVTALPEGEYTLRPHVESADPGGGTTHTQLRALHLHVGCRQIIGATSQIAVSVRTPPPCDSSLVARLDVTTDSERPVALLTWSANGGAPTVLCSPCGPNPAPSFTVPLRGGDNEVVVRATDTRGHEAVSTSWMLRAQEPSAVDLDRTAAPLRVFRDAPGRLRLEWEPVAGATAGVFAGSLDALRTGRYDHASVGACALDVPFAVIDAPPGDAYFLVGGTCALGGVTLGRDSFGAPLPPPSPGCE
jgi:hypothetical protein